jgi:hypothetical protein
MTVIINRDKWISYSHWGMFPVRRRVRATRQTTVRRKAR